MNWRKCKKIFSAFVVITFASSPAISNEKTANNKLPQCKGPDTVKWTDCVGSHITKFSNGTSYVREGRWKGGELDGQGTIAWSDGTKYEGTFKDGLQTELGIYTFADSVGGKYIGYFKDGLYDGYGILIYKNGITYEGEFSGGSYNGQGTLTHKNGKQEGVWRKGIFFDELVVNPRNLPQCPKPIASKRSDIARVADWDNCWGRYKVELSKSYNGDVIEGEWRKGSLNGFGIYKFSNGDKYVGDFKDGQRDGKGAYYHANGERYIGEYKAGMEHGRGVYIYSSGDHQYLGEFKYGKYAGQGIFKFWGSTYFGEFKENMKHGRGLVTWADGSSFEAVFEKDELIKKIEEISKQEITSKENPIGVDKNKKLPTKNLNLNVEYSEIKTDGTLNISIQVNADTASLKINGEEHGGSKNGTYSIRKVARAGQETEFTIVATDINGNTGTKTITVSRPIVESHAKFASLNPAGVKKQPERDAVAIIIGIADYKNLPRADFANDDASVFYDYAIRALGIKPENVKLLVDGNADDVAIYQAFKTWLPSRVRATTDVFVYYSGHGLPAEDGQGLYLLPQRAHRDLIEKTAISQREINGFIQAAKPKSVTIFLDSCYSGLARTGETLLASARPVALKADKKLFPDEFTVITASQADQISSSSPDLKHGIFSYYLMRGMEGEADANRDGKITAGEMHGYLAEQVARQAGMMNRRQEPQLVGDANQVLIQSP